VVKNENEVHIGYKLVQNFPNPFIVNEGSAFRGNRSTTVSFQLPQPQQVEIIIYNQMGQLVRRLANKKMPAGYHQITWDAKDDLGEWVSNSLYFCRLQAGEYTDTIKMVVLK
jgi:flagellar hook assembly protein FlgD